MEEGKRMWDAYQVTERGDGKNFWSKIGVAFLNRDQSINVLLDALPKDGKIQLREHSSNNNGNGKKSKQKGEIL